MTFPPPKATRNVMSRGSRQVPWLKCSLEVECQGTLLSIAYFRYLLYFCVPLGTGNAPISLQRDLPIRLRVDGESNFPASCRIAVTIIRKVRQIFILLYPSSSSSFFGHIFCFVP